MCADGRLGDARADRVPPLVRADRPGDRERSAQRPAPERRRHTRRQVPRAGLSALRTARRRTTVRPAPRTRGRTTRPRWASGTPCARSPTSLDARASTRSTSTGRCCCATCVRTTIARPAPSPNKDWSDPAALGGLPGEPPAEAPTLDALLDELDELTGLDDVKREVRLLVNLTRVEKLRRGYELPGSRSQPPPRVRRQSRHGEDDRRAPARARIYGVLGVLSKGHLIETDRSGSGIGLRRSDRDEGAGDREVRTRRHAVHRRGVRALGRQHRGLRARSDRHPPQAHGRRARQARRRRRRIPRADGRVSSTRTRGSGRGSRRRSCSPTTRPTSCSRSSPRSVSRTRTTPRPRRWPRVRAYVDAQPRGPSFGNARLVRNLFEAAIELHATRVSSITPMQPRTSSAPCCPKTSRRPAPRSRAATPRDPRAAVSGARPDRGRRHRDRDGGRSPRDPSARVRRRRQRRQ